MEEKKNINVNVPVIITGGGPEIMEYFNESLEYIPLYALNQFKKFDAEFTTIKLFEPRELDEISDVARKKTLTNINKKYGGKNLSYYQFYLLSILCNGLCDGIVNSEIKQQMEEYRDNSIKFINSCKYNANILESFSRNGDFWNHFAETFTKGNSQFNKLTFANENFIVNYGYIGLSNDDFTKQECLLSYMIKKEHIPIIRAYWLCGIDVPKGIIEAWMTVPMDQTGYIKGKFKEHIIPVLEGNDITIVHKTIDELKAIWKRVSVPIFNTIPEKKAWLEDIITGFLVVEKENLGIKEKPKFNFGSVKTKLETAKSV